MEDDMKSYREHLVEAERKSIEAYDRALLALCGGGIGVSFAFIRDIIGPGPMASVWLLVSAWVCWVIALTATLFSFYSSHMALRRAIKQVDEKTIHEQAPGGRWTSWTCGLNAASGILFTVGLLCIVLFSYLNMR